MKLREWDCDFLDTSFCLAFKKIARLVAYWITL